LKWSNSIHSGPSANSWRTNLKYYFILFSVDIKPNQLSQEKIGRGTQKIYQNRGTIKNNLWNKKLQEIQHDVQGINSPKISLWITQKGQISLRPSDDNQSKTPSHLPISEGQEDDGKLKGASAQKGNFVLKLDGGINEVSCQEISLEWDKRKALTRSKDEITAAVKAKVLLALEKTILPAKHPARGFSVWESDSRLLQKDRGDEEKSVNLEIKGGACNLSAQMRRTKLRAVKTVMSPHNFH
jgi:hypothetical protein